MSIAGIYAVLVYVIARTAMFLLAPEPFSDKIFAGFLMLCEFFVVLHTIGYMMNILATVRARAEEKREETLTEEPAVALLVAARHEPKQILWQTFASLKALHYRNKTIYFLDDSSDEKYKKEAEELAQELGLVLFRRAVRHGAKAGIVNDCLKTLTQKYVAIFDADQCPLPQFLNVIVPKLERDAKIAFVQTPQFYSNFQESRVARGAAFQQAVFYEYICEGKSSREAMYCCGTNIVFRKEALVQVGGMDETTVTEDFATSLKLHVLGWRSLYIGHVYAFGMGPEDFAGYFKQQFRWANGSIVVFKKAIKSFFQNPASLTLAQWWEYFMSGSYYLVGFAFFFLMLCPVTYLLFKVPGFFVMPELYFLAFVPYFILTIGMFYMVHVVRNYKSKDLIIGQWLAMTTFPIYVTAAVAAFLGIKTTFGITEKGRGKAVSYKVLWPQVALLYVNVIAIAWGTNRYVYERNAVILVNGFWTLYHIFALSGIFYFNEEDVAQIGGHRLSKDAKIDYKVLHDPPILLGKGSWKDCLRVVLPEHLEEGTRLLCKIHCNTDTVIFNGQVLWSSQTKSREGCQADIGLVTISEQDREKLMRAYDTKR